MQQAAEASILVFNTGESQLLDLMEEITRQYPSLKLFSLPHLNERRTIELGVKGEAATVAEGMLHRHYDQQSDVCSLLRADPEMCGNDNWHAFA